MKLVLYYHIWQEDKAKVCDIKVIPSEEEEYVPKHKLLVMDMWFHETKRWHKKFKPRACVEAYEGKDVRNTKQFIPKVIWQEPCCKLPISYNETPKIHPQNFPFDNHHPHLIHPSLVRPLSPSKTTSRSTQPFCHSTLSGQTD